MLTARAQALLASLRNLSRGASFVFSDTTRRHPDRAGPAIAAVTMIACTGFLSGPPTIGLISELTGLRWAFGTLSLLALDSFVLMSRTNRPTQP